MNHQLKNTIPVNCPKCNQYIDLPRNENSIKCLSCGIDVSILNAIILDNSEKEIEYYLSDIRTSYNNGKYFECYDKAQVLISRYSNVPYSWLFLGWSSAQIFTSSDKGINEMIKSFQNAIEIGLPENEIPKATIRTAYLLDSYMLKFINGLESDVEKVDGVQTKILIVPPKNASVSESFGAGIGAGIGQVMIHSMNIKNAKKKNGRSFIETLFPLVAKYLEYLWSLNCSEGLVRITYGSIVNIFNSQAIDDKTKKICFDRMSTLISKMQQSFPKIPLLIDK